MKNNIDFSGKYKGKTDEELRDILEELKELNAGKYSYGEEEVDFNQLGMDDFEQREVRIKLKEIAWLENNMIFGGAIEVEME